MPLVLPEHSDGRVDEVSRQALTFARGFAGGEPVNALLVGPGAGEAAGGLGADGVETAYVAEDGLDAFAPLAWARSLSALAGQTSASSVIAPGTERSNEVMGHLGAITDLPLAANCVAAEPGDPATVTRVRWGGSLLEEARLHGAVKLLTVQPHAVAPAAADQPASGAVETFQPPLEDTDLVARVVERQTTDTGGGVSLADAKVVISGGRGAGSAEGFAPIEELAGLLGAAVGCSRAVTIAGWRPHTDQVGQTGTKIAPDIYIACGISGATQHMAGCKGAKRILAINSDPESSIMQNADYAVIGDLHEVLPAITEEVRKARSA